MPENGNKSVSRRRLLQTTATVSAVSFAGCMGGGDGNNNNSSSSGDSNTLEIIHWWTAGGEQEAFNALIEGFQEEYPDVEINNNPAPGGAGSAQDAVVRNRVLNENPPSTFQIWPGGALAPYTEADALEDVSDVWTQEMQDAYVQGPKQLAQPNGTFVSVPLNVHRLNSLFYNVNVLEQAGVDPTSIQNPQGLVDAMTQVEQNTDAVGLAYSTQSAFITVQLWETIFIGEQGPQAYQDLINGNVEQHQQGIISALQRITEYREFFNEDVGAVSWDQANSQLINGNAAFHHQGDWAAGQYQTQDNFEYEQDWGHIPFPGTQGVYSTVIDSFVHPANNPSPQATNNFLSYCGSVEGQQRFNPVKGSIPARTDVPDDPFGPFLTQQRQDFANSQAQPGSIGHGSAVVPDVKNSIEETMTSFTSNWDVQEAYNGIQSAFSNQ